ncbi:MAG: DUF2993 domain-containing protein [Actinomycetota bacterium]|nr:DUF2993 domain-containing protein [Actinomycetota bacterium]
MLVLVAVALIGTYTFLPPLMGNLFGKSIKNEMGLQTTPQVNLKSEPPPTILAGTFAEGQISLGGAEFGGVRPRRVTIDLDPFDLNLLKSVRGGEFTSEEPLSGDLRMEVSEKEVSRIATADAEDVSIDDVSLEKDRVTVESGTQVLGVDVPVAVRGGLEIQDQALVFEPGEVSAFGVRVPDRLSRELLAQADFSYPLEDLPYDANISEVQVKKDYLVLSGRLNRIPLGETDG